MDDVTIRRAVVEDALAVAALNLQMGLELGHPRQPGFLDRYAGAWAGASGRRPTWLAESGDGRPLGALVAAQVDKLPRLGRDDTCWLHVSSLFVTGNARGHGLAEELLRAMIQWARDHRVDRIQLNAVAPARALYQRVGFEAPDQRLMELRP